MSKIRNLMFDLGGVVMDIDASLAVNALEKLGLKSASQLIDPYFQKGIFLALERGEICAGEFHRELRGIIAGESGNEVSDRDIDAAFGAILIGIPVERLRQLEELGRQGYGIYLLSNTNPVLWDGPIQQEFRKDGKSMDYYFDGTVASFEVHAYKPDRQIFDIAARRFGIIPGETLFFDDSARNVEAARSYGFHAVHVADTSRPFASYIR